MAETGTPTKGPFTHSFGPTLSAQFESWERIGRWPGLVAIWDRIWPPVRPAWDWLLHGHRVKKTITFPNATINSVGGDITFYPRPAPHPDWPDNSESS